MACEKLSSVIARRLELPLEAEAGVLPDYRLRQKARSRWLSYKNTLDEAGIEENDVLQLELYHHPDYRPIALMVLLLLASVAFFIFALLRG